MADRMSILLGKFLRRALATGGAVSAATGDAYGVKYSGEITDDRGRAWRVTLERVD